MNLIDESMHSLRPWIKEGVLSKGKIDSKTAGQLVQSGNAVRRGATDTPILEL
tara:strand:+ start:707 stop:865 length:159 start_codon:yes stop_codon:yes gene_type:complete